MKQYSHPDRWEDATTRGLDGVQVGLSERDVTVETKLEKARQQSDMKREDEQEDPRLVRRRVKEQERKGFRMSRLEEQGVGDRILREWVGSSMEKGG